MTELVPQDPLSSFPFSVHSLTTFPFPITLPLLFPPAHSLTSRGAYPCGCQSEFCAFSKAQLKCHRTQKAYPRQWSPEASQLCSSAVPSRYSNPLLFSTYLCGVTGCWRDRAMPNAEGPQVVAGQGDSRLGTPTSQHEGRRLHLCKLQTLSTWAFRQVWGRDGAPG